jgi:hypothetical protein
MVSSVEQLQEMYTECRRHEIALENEALEALDEWVGAQVASCRDASGIITRASVRNSSNMNQDLFTVLCRSLRTDGHGVAALSNRYLTKHRGISSLIRFEAVNMGMPSIRLFYKH